jgi:glycosyltransferase involved in cell wall biosynthesis
VDRGLKVVVGCAARGIPLYGPTGASAHLRGVARALERAGHHVLVATPLREDERGAWDLSPPLRSVHLPTRWPRGLRTFGARVDAHLLAARIGAADLLWERHEPRGAGLGRWARARGIPHLVELNAPLPWERRWPRGPRLGEARREAELLRAADRVVAVSGWLARWAADLGCARVDHVPNGVAHGFAGERDRARAELGLEGPVVGFVGSGHAWHGVDRLPALLDALGPGWHGVVVGGAAPAHPRLIATGRVPDDQLPHYVAAFDVGVAPYRRGSPPWFCPLKVLEYRAQGVPVVASDVGDCAALVGEGRVLRTEDPRAWAEAVRAALDQPRVRWVRTWDDVVREVLS